MSVKTTYQSIREHRVAGPVVRFLGENSVIVAFIAMVIIATILARDSFMSQTNIINILRSTSIIGIISLGMTLIIISGGIDLSVGSGLVLMGAAGIWVLNATHNIPLGLITTLAGGVLIGAINGTIITRGRVTPFIATLGVMATCRSLALYLLNGAASAPTCRPTRSLQTAISSGSPSRCSISSFSRWSCTSSPRRRRWDATSTPSAPMRKRRTSRRST